MATYEYRCRVCDRRFEEQRPMGEVATLIRCPDGHDDVARIWSAVAVTGGAKDSAPAPSAGGCCGGGCGCG